MRLLINEDPFPLDMTALPWSGRGQWECSWVSLDPKPEQPFVAAYRLLFEAPIDEIVRVHVTADERYELWLDGQYVGRGSERGDGEHWFFETYELELSAGPHVLVAKAWSLGEKAPYAQISAGHGFLLCPQTGDWQERIGTGKAAWEAKELPGYELTNPLTAWGTGWNVAIHGDAVAWGWENGEGDGWSPVAVGLRGMSPGVNDRTPYHLLVPAVLPPMLERRWPTTSLELVAEAPEGPTNVVAIRKSDDLIGEHEDWMRLLADDEPLTIPPHTRRRILVDLEDYVCAYPRAVLSGGKGARLRINWQESLYETVEGAEKGNRDEIEGKFFNTIWHKSEGVGDTFVSGGSSGQRFDTLWWQAGRYVELLVETQNDSLTIERLELIETHYPYEFDATFSASDERLEAIIPIMRRVLEMCSHETYMDCPYFEQLQYIGDTRLQVLVTYAQTNDDRLPRKSIRMFDASRQMSGLTQSRYPCRVLQIIPPFSLWWVTMLHDFALWRGDLEFVRERMLGARGVLDAYRAKVDSDQLLGGVDGWNFVDWVPSWNSGMPKDAVSGKSSVLNLQFALTLAKAAEIEEWLGEPEMAARHRRTAKGIISAVNDHFWSEERGLYANDLAHTEFSEHAQCLALLADAVPAERRESVVRHLLEDDDLDRTTVYFSHYLFETYTLLGRTDQILKRMDLWFEHPAKGMKTTVEMPEPTRSDCHAWGAHPLFHYYASFLGIRPTAPGFSEVEIRPQLGGLMSAEGTMPTPRGEIFVSVDGSGISVKLPPGMREVVVHDKNGGTPRIVFTSEGV
ncbi:alpha-L-rhamnosidase C-terminal domain-containing protein [Fimbriimonas ginsengisoli]|uniref:Alpha-L-rhamnosidase n=1 Tax=Fimbriimonas ginsengisoli Gsoil 348 TaxID=661478 RepID=A0A068NU23_FIMGI|nr:alpha-L-rhamnosidase C-terminal domain-containing protein [Fimbriimonas ginsengisoli]AIE86280.1 alpha-L-rhamnosidase [Fimbriimonas ginsengisoli Gsoil 348]